MRRRPAARDHARVLLLVLRALGWRCLVGLAVQLWAVRLRGQLGALGRAGGLVVALGPRGAWRRLPGRLARTTAAGSGARNVWPATPRTRRPARSCGARTWLTQAPRPDAAADRAGGLRPSGRNAADRGGPGGVRRALRRPRRHPAGPGDVRAAGRQLLRRLPRRRRPWPPAPGGPAPTSRRSGTTRTAEIKRMYVAPRRAGAGHARRDARAPRGDRGEAGAEAMILETGMAQPEAIALYESSGYTPIPPFGYYKDSPTQPLLRQAPRLSGTPVSSATEPLMCFAMGIFGSPQDQVDLDAPEGTGSPSSSRRSRSSRPSWPPSCAAGCGQRSATARRCRRSCAAPVSGEPDWMTEVRRAEGAAATRSRRSRSTASTPGSASRRPRTPSRRSDEGRSPCCCR